jgi:hypothetical protein
MKTELFEVRYQMVGPFKNRVIFQMAGKSNLDRLIKKKETYL